MDSAVELSAAECRDLLATDVIGRVAFSTTAGPRIVPVNYRLIEDGLEFRTTPYSELATFAPGEPIAFEIDHFDGEHRRGWSVIALGVCQRMDEPTSSADDDDDAREPWAGGHRPVVLRLPWSELTGRRVGERHWPHPVVSGRGRDY